MKIAHVKIKNILGIAELEFTPAGFTEITGRNGEGKTSVLEALKSALKSGHDATLLRQGESQGEVVLVLDDGTEIGKRVTPRTSKSRVSGAQQTPAEALKQLTDILSVNPVEFLRARKQDRGKVLLDTMPVDIDIDKLSLISGVKVGSVDSANPLATIEAVRKHVYDDRTGTNRAIKEKESTINQLRIALPEVPGGVDGSEDDLRAQIDTLKAERDAELERIRNKLAGIVSENNDAIQALQAEAQRRIDEIKSHLNLEIGAIKEREREIEGKAAQQRERTIQKHTDATLPLNQALASIRTHRDMHAKRAQTLKIIEDLEKELAQLEADAQRQSHAITDIDQYKCDLLASMPIPGLEIRDGEVFRNGIPFERLNTSQQVSIAFEIAKMRAGDLGIVCLDGLELMDRTHLEELKRQAADAGLQVFITRVTDESFGITTE